MPLTTSCSTSTARGLDGSRAQGAGKLSRMGLQLYMVGVIVADMERAVEFYRRLGLEIPEGSENQEHVEVKMGELTFFLSTKRANAKWDPEPRAASGGYRIILEFYLETRRSARRKVRGDDRLRLRAPLRSVRRHAAAPLRDGRRSRREHDSALGVRYGTSFRLSRERDRARARLASRAPDDARPAPSRREPGQSRCPYRP